MHFPRQTSGPIQWSTVSKTWLHLSCPARKTDHRKTRGILFFPHDKTLQGVVNSTELFKLCLGMCPSPLLLPITVLMQFWDLYWVTLTVKLALSSSQTHKICITGLLLDNNIDLVNERSHNPHHRCITECTPYKNMGLPVCLPKHRIGTGCSCCDPVLPIAQRVRSETTDPLIPDTDVLASTPGNTCARGFGHSCFPG